MSFPKRIQQHKNEDDSLAIIQDDLKEVGVFRNQTSNDYGIDIEIENKGRMEGHSLKVQVKSSDDLYIRKDGHATVGGIKQSTLNYWAEISYNIPVVGMAVDLNGNNRNIYVSDLLFWQIIPMIEPSGDEEKKDEKGHIISPPTKTMDFGGEYDNQKNIEKLRRYAYGYGLRDFLNAHKWLLTNIKEIFQMFSDATYCDYFSPIYEPMRFKTFLQQSKAFIYYDLGFRTEDALDRAFDYDYYVAKGGDCEPCNHDVATGMQSILQKLLLPLLQKYRNLVYASTYYWANKDSDYLKLVFDVDFPDWNDENAMLSFGYDERKKRWGNSDWVKFIDDQQKRYGITDNSLLAKLL